MSITANEKDYLMREISALLDEYDYDYTYGAIKKIVDEWADQKESIIDAFKTHPNYVEGKFMIAFDCDYERTIDKTGAREFSKWIRYTALPMVEVPADACETDSFGRTDIKFSLMHFFRCLDNHAYRTVNENTAELLNGALPDLRVHVGQKTSRVVNKLCTYLGLHKVEGYNKEYAKYADSLSPLTITRHTILSVHPVDYLTMSFGNSWSSCHTIDKHNRRNMPNGYRGQYSSGTISYMLDKTSMVFYTVDADYNGDEYYTQPKINRQMFHWGYEKLIQSRLYPQSNDYNADMYTPNREIVQRIMAEIFKFPNWWTVAKGEDKCDSYIRTRGTHYPDYCYFHNVNMSRPKGTENAEVMTIGADPICVDCGERHGYESSISCCESAYCCSDCGCILDEDDVYWVDGEPYCNDCVSYCEWCDGYHVGDSYYISDRDIYVCESCYDDHFYVCNCCDETVRDVVYIENEGVDVCLHCLEEYYTHCCGCLEYFNRDNVHWVDNMAYCEDCYNEYLAKQEKLKETETNS